jgi:hypothetical protein
VKTNVLVARRLEDRFGFLVSCLGLIDSTDRGLNFGEDFGLAGKFALRPLRRVVQRFGNFRVPILGGIGRHIFRAGERQRFLKESLDLFRLLLLETRPIALLPGYVGLL